MCAILHEFFKLRLGGHVEPCSNNPRNIVLGAGNVVANVLTDGFLVTAIEICAPVVSTVLYICLSPGVECAIIIGLISSHVAAGPLGAAGQPEVNQVRMVVVWTLCACRHCQQREKRK